MTTAQDQQSRADFEAWARRACYEVERHDSGQYARNTTEQVWQSWQAARALPATSSVSNAHGALPARGVEHKVDAPAGMEPVAGQCRFIGEEKWKPCAAEHVRMVLADPRYAAEGYEVRYVYTAAQVQAMGRVPPGWQAVERQLLEDAEQALANFVSEHDWGDSDMIAMDNLSAVLAAAPRPPAAQEGA